MGSLTDNDDFLDDDLFDQIPDEELLELSVPKRGVDDGNDPSPVPNKKARYSDDSNPLEIAENDSRLQLAKKILTDKFGYKSFRHEQEAAIQRTLHGENTLVIFPTGAGKSLCYQIPAIAFEEVDQEEGSREPGESGITIVVSPLIALMKDQVDVLKRKGIAAELLASTNEWQEAQRINESLRQGKVRLLYCAPERLNNEGFVETMKRVKGGVRLVAVDEAHCVSEWGHSFRPDYLKVARFIQEIKAERAICLTATATPLVADDICKSFNISKEGVFRTSPYRSNLRLEVQPMATQKEKYPALFKFLRSHQGSSLIYVTLQKQAEELAMDLRKNGVPAEFFHAGQKPDEKRRVQDGFMNSKIRTVVATIAFGMGIDKSDLRNVIHWDLPSTIEEYCQQVGRAGRDGKQSYCMFYLCPEDRIVKEGFARGDMPAFESVKNLLGDIFYSNSKVRPGDTFKVSHYSQGSEFDIRSTTLGVIYAALELRFNLIRATTPEYNSYKFEATPNYDKHLQGRKSPEANALLKYAKKAKKYHSIDLSTTATVTGLRRPDLVRFLNELNDTGVINLSVSGVEQKYKVMTKLPETSGEIEKLAEDLYDDLKKRERQALDKISQVFDFVTGPKCFSLFIAEHFGMTLPDGSDRCGHCTFCFQGKPVQLPPSKPRPVDQTAVKAICNATGVRNDPRFLTRIALGISSPRVIKEKLNRDPVFGSMAEGNFDLILKEFEKVCKE